MAVAHLIMGIGQFGYKINRNILNPTRAHFYILPRRICASCGAERLKPQTLRRFAPDKGFPLRCFWQLSHKNTTTVTRF